MAQIVNRPRIRLLIFLTLTLAAFIILAAGLSELQLETGGIQFEEVERPQIIQEDTPETAAPPEEPPSRLYIVAAIGVALFLLFVAWRSRQARMVLLVLGLFTGSLLVMIYLSNFYGRPPETDAADVIEFTETERLEAEAEPIPPDWYENLSIFVTIGVVALAAAGFWFGWSRLRRRGKPPLEIIAAEAEAALADIRSGANLKDAVLRCYFDMNQALRQRMGLVRQEGMTPREFESVLAQAGLPQQAVQQLTRLFEQVRYGGQSADERQRQTAVNSLEMIIQAAQSRGVTAGQ